MLLPVLVNGAFVALWLVLGFVAVRFLARYYFHEQYRASIVAVGIVFAFTLGAVWPFANRVFVPLSAGNGVLPNSSSAVAVGPIEAVRDVSTECALGVRPQPGGAGDVDSITDATNHAVVDGAKLDSNRTYNINGWAADRTGKIPAVAVCLVVDGRILASAHSFYGGERPDVASATRVAALLPSAFSIAFVAGDIGRGFHRLQAAARSADGSYLIVPVGRSVTVR